MKQRPATPYHRLARETPSYAWWKLPVAGLVVVATYLALTIVLVGAAAIWFSVSGSSSTLEDWLDAVGELDLAQLDFFVLDMLGLVILIPAVFLGVRVVGPRPAGLSSVTGRLRWGWLVRALVISSAVFIVTLGSALLLTELTDPQDVAMPSGVGRDAVIAIIVILLIVPFQAAAEEYVFRGYLLQLVGSWSRFAFLPVIITTPLFVAGHAYDLWGLLDVGLFGLTAAILTIRTGGLEAAIAAHTVNNVLLFILDALGVIAATDDSGAGPLDLVPTVISSILLLVLVERAARHSGIQRTRDPIPEPQRPEAPMWPPPPYAMIWYGAPGWPQAAPSQWSPVSGPQPQAPGHGPSERSEQGQAPVRSTAAATEEPLGRRGTSRALHPDTPDYPGELPPDWRG